MSDEFDDVVTNLKQSSAWVRILIMLGFLVVLYVVGIVVIVLTLTQALFSVIGGKDNRNLRLLGAAITEYVAEVLKFLSYNSEVRPFPFSPFPGIEDAGEETSESVTKPEPARKTAARKKSPAKKKTLATKKTAGKNDGAEKEK